MLSESSYHQALLVYTGSGLLLVLFLAWWLGRRWPGSWTALAVLLCAALLLTPAYPGPGITTFAPALVVAAFQIFTEGIDAARHALRPLAVMCGAAVVLALVLRLTVLRRRRRPVSRSSSPAEEAD